MRQYKYRVMQTLPYPLTSAQELFCIFRRYDITAVINFYFLKQLYTVGPNLPKFIE